MNVERLLNYIGLSKKDPINRLTKKAEYDEFIKKQDYRYMTLYKLFHTSNSIRCKKIFYC